MTIDPTEQHPRGTGELNVEYYAALVANAQPHLRSPQQIAWLSWLDAELPNIRLALEASRNNPTQLLHLCAHLGSYWHIRGYVEEGRQWLSLALADSSVGPMTVRGLALREAGELARQQGDFAAARQYYEESLIIRRQLNDQKAIAGLLNNLGSLSVNEHDYATAKLYFDEALTLRRSLKDVVGEAWALYSLGNVLLEQGDTIAAQAHFAQSLEMNRGQENTSGTGWSLLGLGRTALREQAPRNAQTFLNESLEAFQLSGVKAGIAAAQRELGAASLQENDLVTARARLQAALDAYREIGNSDTVAEITAQMEKLADLQDH